MVVLFLGNGAVAKQYVQQLLVGRHRAAAQSKRCHSQRILNQKFTDPVHACHLDARFCRSGAIVKNRPGLGAHFMRMALTPHKRGVKVRRRYCEELIKKRLRAFVKLASSGGQARGLMKTELP